MGLPFDNYVFLDDQRTGRQLYFTSPETIITANRCDDVAPAFAAIEAALADGKYIAGYFAYELGLALEPSLHDLLGAPQTLLKLGVFNPPSHAAPAQLLYSRKSLDIQMRPDWSETDYISRFERLKDYITKGHCYQSNLTFPLRGQTDASAEQIFAAFRQNQPGRYGALLKLGGPDIISFSPELFFERSPSNMSPNIRMRPMKGTRPRGHNNDNDIAQAMRADPKSQAENLMIVDLLRNDLSRLAKTGSVKVPELFTLETYPTLHQMTSQVTAQVNDNVSWLEIFKGLYPCGSVTGAPKIRAMEIISELESGPRGPYCGAIGFIAPDHSACFNVAIRTAVLDKGTLRYDVGSGVVYDSCGADEYRECLLKSHILRQAPEHIFETFRRDTAGHYIRLGAHLARLQSACRAKGWDYPETIIKRKLDKLAKSHDNQALRVRLQIGPDAAGRIDTHLTHLPFHKNRTPISIALSRYALRPELQETSLKTSRRQFYDGERARIQAQHPVDEVIFLSPSDTLCEGSFTSLYLEIDGQLFTPPLSANILPSILRADLIETGKAFERILDLNDLARADKIYCGNSLRGLQTAKLITNKRL